MNTAPEAANDAPLPHEETTIQQEALIPDITAEDYTVDEQKWFAAFVPSKEYFVTPLIVLVNVAVFGIMLIRGGDVLAFSPEFLSEWGGNIRRLTLDGEPWRLFTSVFVHTGILHLVFNTLALLMIGRQVEPKIGALNFAGLYVCTGLVASMTSMVWHVNAVSAGASGAIFGMLGLLLGMLLSKTVYFKNRESVLISVSILVVYNLIGGMKAGVDNAAHIGGLVSGFAAGSLAGSYLVENDERNRSPLSVIICSVVCVGICWIGLSMTANTMKMYEEAMDKFRVRENEALAILRMDANIDTEEIVYQLVDRGVYYWEENVELLKTLKTLGLPAEYEHTNDLLLQYCGLRIDSFRLLAKAYEEKTDKYTGQLQEYDEKIKALFK